MLQKALAIAASSGMRANFRRKLRFRTKSGKKE
jgi:hypothetical protein